jgi:hypothetical protein
MRCLLAEFNASELVECLVDQIHGSSSEWQSTRFYEGSRLRTPSTVDKFMANAEKITSLITRGRWFKSTSVHLAERTGSSDG